MIPENELHASLRYLESDEALESLAADAYWPKWDSPWWQMRLLHELGETKLIPKAAIRAHVEALDRMPVKFFPIEPGELPDGVDPFRGTPCHCQLGTVYQVLSAWGVDVDRELPWIRSWLLRYQMPDGGLNCDSDAYLVKNEVPSSMVGTISAFEAILLHTPRQWTAEERAFLERGAQFLIERRLVLGSSTRRNAAERASAELWPQLCFPRFYFYDVLRGLSALLAWSEKVGQPPPEAALEVASTLRARFPDGDVRIGRQPFVGNTRGRDANGVWERRPAAQFPLLVSVSEAGRVSPFLSREWAQAEARIAALSAKHGP
ncbi:hypothetical protein [Vulgatibacter incomptus]|uniref:Uncharacterized protein n=1 Tax=Vulgatibacter incomptus TaxID=1391653 RepID=A0A0K1PGN2_9BACT|nr:hypothetical protein [Vulgatibacter incomptus]AKU92698.1 hypothetical protein AKJ08_3085 [Vulgatibacter incomptus]